ncbi:hypothetical protein OFR75_14840 [Brachyspira hyodysenteriae]|nr:hypothetical protein [Brachyspira hyodysenteriae]
MYNNFVELCNKINIDNIKFIVVGGPNHLKLEEYTKKLGYLISLFLLVK